MSRQPLGIRLLLHTLLLLGMGLTLAPYAWMVSSSFKPHTDIFSAALELIPRRPILDNYVVAVTREPTLRAIGNSLIMAGAETLAVVVTSVLTAYPFARLRFRGRDAVFIMVLGTMMIPAQVTMVPTFILLRWLGWIDTYQGLIVPRIVTPIGIFLIRQFLLTLPRELEAHLGPAVATLAIFTFTASWNEFFWPLIVVQSSEMRTIQLLIAALKQTEAVEWGVVMAVVTLSVLPTVAIYLTLQPYFQRGIVMSGLKG
jgi:multiple sugar transport system permease protein